MDLEGEAVAVLFAGVGLALLVTALLGKAVKLGGVEPPAPTSRIGRAITGALGATLLVVSLVMAGVVPGPGPDPSGSPSPSVSASTTASTTASPGDVPTPTTSVPTPSADTGPTPVMTTPPPVAISPWRGVPASFSSGIDAAVSRFGPGYMYLFDEDVYVRFNDLVSGPGGPVTSTAGNWHGMPPDFQAGIDAATENPDGRIYFFEGDRYIRFPLDLSQDATDPVAIAGNWRGMPAEFNDGIDAALTDLDGHIYFFAGSQYVRFTDIAAGMEPGYPKAIASRWTGMPGSFDDGIDAALMATDGSVFFFKGNEYIRFAPGQTQMEPGYPRLIDS